MVQLLALPSCLGPAKPRDLVDTGFRTPEQALKSFQVFLRADLPEKEYLAFSAGFRRRHGMSSLTYAEARERLFREKPWLRHFARAEVVAQWSEPGSEGVHFIDARVFGRTIRVRLVREDFFEIWAGDRLLADGEAHFPAAVETASVRSPELRVRATVTFEDSAQDLSDASWFTVGREWKIDDLYEPQHEPEPAADAARSPA